MGKARIWKIVWKILPAVAELIADLVAATRKDSEGGKEITVTERDDMVDGFLVKLRPVILHELVKHG